MFKQKIGSKLLLGLLLTANATNVFGQKKPNFGEGAVVLETRQLPATSHPHRALVLWMESPRKNPTSIAADEPYTCPDYTRGSHFSGPTRVSLIDSSTGEIVNTIKIITESNTDSFDDSFDLPYAIRRGYYYRVPGPGKNGVERKPDLMWLRDYNGDGKSLEFALFDAAACMGLATTLIGYSDKSDRVIQYPLRIEEVEGRKRTTRTTLWADYLFNKKPLRQGYWKYEIDYRGRAGSLDRWTVRYNASKEQFEGTVIRIPGE